ncbi:hypothetical protein chiPu_0024001, partial [Chiloscyllium punctatum]|nr:hypothetical protein [Chiloscyllium punctatum]
MSTVLPECRCCERSVLVAGSRCDVDIDDCVSSPCYNGGTCQDGVNGFSCVCPEGYSDPQCVSRMEHCQSNPCAHGTCFNHDS